MFVVELAFDDDPRRLGARTAHRERLEQLRSEDVVRLAGPLADDSGALLVFDVADRETLQTVMDQDPYYKTPGVTVQTVREWKTLWQ